MRVVVGERVWGWDWIVGIMHVWERRIGLCVFPGLNVKYRDDDVPPLLLQ